MAGRSESKLNKALCLFFICCLYFPVKSLKTEDSTVEDGGNSSQDVLEEEPVFYQGVYGKPGVDFPILSHIPKTAFSCRELESGYYADLQTDCQVFHICEEGKKISFLCPNGTIFQQSELICEWWFKVNCTNSPNLYETSAEQLREENARRKASRRVYADGDDHGAVMRTEQHSTVRKFQKGRDFGIVSTSTRRNQQFLRKFEEKPESRSKDAKLDSVAKFEETPQYVNIRVNGRTTPPNQNHYVNIKANSISTPTKVESNQNIKLTVSTKLGGTPVRTLQQNQSFTTDNRQNKKIDFTDNTNRNIPSSNVIYGRKSEPNQITSEAKDITIKQNISTYKENSEAASSEETQIPQESSSFYKNSINSIQQSYKPTTVHPNHRETYSDIKEPQHYSTKIFSAISSVTPQYLTTQSINNGRPFVGSQVGSNFNVQKSTASPISSSTTSRPSIFVGSQVGSNFNVQTSTASPIVGPTTALPLTFVGSQGGTNFNAQKSTASPIISSITTLPSTFLGSRGGTYFNVQKSTASPIVGPTTALPLAFAGSQGGTNFNAQKSTASPIISSTTTLPSTFVGSRGGTYFNVQKSTASPIVGPTTALPLTFVGSQGGTNFNAQKSTASPIVGSTTTLPSTFVGNQVGSNFNIQKSPIISSTKTLPPAELPKFVSSTISKTSGFNIPLDLEAPAINSNQNKFTSTVFGPKETTTRKIDQATVYGRFVNSATPTAPTFATTSAKFLYAKPFDLPTTASPQNSVFGITKNSTFTSNSYSSVASFGYTTTPIPDEYENFKFTNEVQRPRPFKLSTSGSSYLPGITTQLTQRTTPTPTASYPTYKVSSASPFTKTKSEDVATTTPSSLPSTFENIESMISALAEMAQSKERFGESARPGLVVPPSAGPQTLHTLAVYFANALDGLAEDKEEGDDDKTDDNDDEGLSQAELDKKRLTALLTQMTMDRYNELFSDSRGDSEETTTLSNRDGDSDLEAAHTKNAVPDPKVRQLAKVFTQALSSYLDDPVTFRRVLAEVRPTEPPNGETEETPSETEDELLNFSDADVKSSFPPVFPTAPSVQPTWGYLIAYNTSNTFDSAKNSLNPDQEHLQLADSQSFVSQFNKLKVAEKDLETTTKSSSLPNSHWTRSPDATKLWKSAFTFNPAVINENLETTTESIKITATPEEEIEIDSSSTPLVPHHEIKYELRALPRLALNSTQVHGILIDFMNNTKSDDDNRLQRILRKLNTTEDEFLKKMKEIESNPLTRRLILLLISECGANATQEIETQAVPIHDLISRNLQNRRDVLEPPNDRSVVPQNHRKTGSTNSSLKEIVDPTLDEESEDTRALQLLNSLYTIASKFGLKGRSELFP